MSLTLPIEIGKKYVRRDGAVVTAREPHSDFGSIGYAFVYVGVEALVTSNLCEHAFADTGAIYDSADDPLDLVADYVEEKPALTLPIQIGKKYVRRDGVVVTAREPHDFFGPNFAFAGDSPRVCKRGECHIFKDTGRSSPSDIDSKFDLVADYVEPAAETQEQKTPKFDFVNPTAEVSAENSQEEAPEYSVADMHHPEGEKVLQELAKREIQKTQPDVTHYAPFSVVLRSSVNTQTGEVKDVVSAPGFLALSDNDRQYVICALTDLHIAKRSEESRA